VDLLGNRSRDSSSTHTGSFPPCVFICLSPSVDALVADRLPLSTFSLSLSLLLFFTVAARATAKKKNIRLFALDWRAIDSATRYKALTTRRDSLEYPREDHTTTSASAAHDTHTTCRHAPYSRPRGGSGCDGRDLKRLSYPLRCHIRVRTNGPRRGIWLPLTVAVRDEFIVMRLAMR
jgi:hypothetical protein